MLSSLIKPDMRRMLILVLLPLCLLVGLGGCIDNSTTNPSTADPVVPNPDATPTVPDPITPPEETFGPTTGFKIISAGGDHNCSIKNLDGSLWCWGNNQDSQLGNDSTASLSSPTAISTDFWQMVIAGDKHSCGIDENGELFCWGKNDSGQVGNGSTIIQAEPAAISANTDWRDVSLGSIHSCAIKNTDNSLWCWGSNTSSQLGHTPTNTRRPSKLIKTNADETTTTEQWSATANGNSHTCAIKDDKTLWCWGGNDKGQLGQGTISTLLSEPTEVATGGQWLSIAANGDHSCAIKNDNSLWCWGDNSAGQVGNDSSLSEITTPTAIGSTWNKISLGTNHSCGIKTGGTLWCWGDNTHSKLGDNTTAASLAPKKIGAASWLEISLGDQFSCGINASKKLYCWGSNTSNQQGHLPPDTANSVDMTVPTLVDGVDSDDWSSISSGDTHSCAIKADDTLWCWGSNASGQTAQTINTETPTQEPSQSLWLKIAADGNNSCAVKNDSSLWCWGNNTFGQLGNGSINLSTSPAPVLDESIWIWLSLGVDHSCAIKDDKTLWCWGDNSESQLGDNSTINSTTPKQIGLANTWSNISLGNQFSCGIQTDATTTVPSQTLWCWGKNDKSQLGHDSPDTKLEPSQVGTAEDWAGISTGDNHACAFSSNQYLYCWGDNLYGQLGLSPNPPPAAATTPTSVDSNKWLGVSAGGNHTCAVQDDYSLWCWGNNDAGQLGIGSTSHQPKPNLVTHSDALDWRFVSSGKNHTCAIDSDYIGHCWGLNDQGQLGNGINLNTSAARLFDSSNNWLSIDSGTLHSCGIKTDPFTLLKTLWCGGINNYGQLGIASTANQSAPIEIKGPDGTLEDWEYVSTGHFHTCAITDTSAADDSGALYCWGRNSHAQLAKTASDNGATNWSLSLQNKILPPAPDNTDNWIKVDAGASHTCGIKNTDELWCWGDNLTNQMGQNTANPADPTDPVNTQTIPVAVADTWIDVAVGGYTNDTDHLAGGHTCAIKTDGTLWCWGENDAYQLGDQTTTNRTIPTQIIVDTAANGFPPQFNNSWESVKAGNRFTCGLQTDQHLYCWGDHSLGQTGIGTIDFTNPAPISPRLIAGNHSVISYAVGQNTACAITTDNKLWCWGDNFSDTPANRLSGNNWQSLTLGMNHGCGIREDATSLNRNVYCWGEGAEFQFGNGSAWKETPQTISLQ